MTDEELAALLRGDPCQCACCARDRDIIAAIVADGFALVREDDQQLRRLFPPKPRDE